MPCGHVISTESMIQYLDSVLDKQLYVIRCPGDKPDGTKCDREWPFQLCKKVGMMTKNELEHFEERFALLTARTFLAFQECR